MKRMAPIIYLAVLLISLVLAYLTWTEGPEKPEGEATLLACGKGEIQKITLREKERKVVYDRRESAWSGESVWWVEALRLPFEPAARPDPETAGELDVDVASMGPAEDAPEGAGAGAGDGDAGAQGAGGEAWTVAESFLGNDSLREALEGFCPWKGLRSLGKLGEEKREEFGLTDSEDVLVLDLRGKPRTFRIGKASFGPGDRYVEDEKSGEIFLVKGQSIKDLLYPKSRYMERTLHAFDEKDVVRMGIREGNRQMELVHHVSPDDGEDVWSEAGKTEDPKALFKNWVRKVFSLRPVDYVLPAEGGAGGEYGCAPPPGAATAAAITFLGEKDQLGFLTLYKTAGEPGKEEYFACTERTNAVVKVSRVQAENLLKDLADILPEG